MWFPLQTCLSDPRCPPVAVCAALGPASSICYVDAEDMLEATHQEAAEPAADPMDQDGRDAMPDSDQMVQDAQQEQQQQQPEAMQEDLVKPIARPVRLHDSLQGPQGTPKAVASTLVSSLPTSEC